MDFIPLHEIIVPPKRVRVEFNPRAAEELYSSIKTSGLFHPLLVRDDGVTLIAGERRLRALDQLFSHRAVVYFDGKVLDGVVPVVRLHDADAEAALEAELAENDRRQQLTWQEKAAAVEALHQFRVSKNTDHTKKDTADELKTNPVTVNDDLLVAGWLDDKEVREAPTKSEALKIIERRVNVAHRAALARDFKVDPHSDLQLYNWTMQAGAQFLSSNQAFDLIIADPPYGIDAGQWDNQSAIPHSYEDNLEQSDELYQFIATNIPVRSEAHAYIFLDPRRFAAISATFSRAGWRVWPWPLVWDRGSSIGLLPWPHHGPRRTWEGILFAIKGDRRPTAVFPDVIRVAHDATVERGAHKPPALYAELIKRSCNPGDRVIDPCCGTGPIFTAAAACRVKAVGFEPDNDAFNQALRRIEDAKTSPRTDTEDVLSPDDLGI